MENLKYQSVDYVLTDAQKDRVTGWVKTGSKDHPVGVFGASAELLFHTLQTREVPSYDTFGKIELDWQQKILDRGKHLYYVTAIYTGIKRTNAPLARKIRESYEEAFSTMRDQTSLKGARRTGINYANTMALTDAFIREFGAYRERREIWAMATTLFPSFARDNEKNPATSDLEKLDFTEENHRERKELGNKSLTLQQFHDKLAIVFRRRGVLWYYNDGIFKHEVIPGIEAEGEIMILPRTPLSLDVISGVEILGEEERKLLLP